MSSELSPSLETSSDQTARLGFTSCESSDQINDPTRCRLGSELNSQVTFHLSPRLDIIQPQESTLCGGFSSVGSDVCGRALSDVFGLEPEIIANAFENHINGKQRVICWFSHLPGGD